MHNVSVNERQPSGCGHQHTTTCTHIACRLITTILTPLTCSDTAIKLCSMGNDSCVKHALPLPMSMGMATQRIPALCRSAVRHQPCSFIRYNLVQSSRAFLLRMLFVFILLMHLPKYALSGSPSGMETRLQDALADPTLLDQSSEVQAVTPVRSRQRSTDVALAARIQHLTIAGSIERAAAALDPQPLASNTPEAIHPLRALHLLEPPPTIPAVDVPPITCDEKTLAQVARSLKRGKASGECDGTYEMLQAAIFGCPAGLRTCLAFVNAMLAFTITRVDALLNSRGVAFEKPNRRGVRPIAICEAWLRLAAIVCIRLLPDAKPSLAPLQLGVGTPGGAENIGHAINAALRSDPGSTVALSHDWANAFNTIHRADVFATVTSRHHSLVPFTNLLYGAHSTVRFFSGNDSGTVDVVSAPGYAKETPSGPSSSHWCFNDRLRPLLLHTLRYIPSPTLMTHTLSDPGPLSLQPSTP
jgi:hypothetical protein